MKNPTCKPSTEMLDICKDGWARVMLCRVHLVAVPQSDGARIKIKISEHVSDVKGFTETVLPGRRPVFISHR